MLLDKSSMTITKPQIMISSVPTDGFILHDTLQRCDVTKPTTTEATRQQLVCSHSQYTAKRLDEMALAFGFTPTNQGRSGARLIRALALDPHYQIYVPDDYTPDRINKIYYQEQASNKIAPHHYRLMKREGREVLFEYCRLLGLEFRSSPHPAALLTGIAYGQVVLLQLK